MPSSSSFLETAELLAKATRSGTRRLSAGALARRVLIGAALVSTTAVGARVVHAEYAATVDTSVDHALNAITSEDVCMHGCRYQSHNIAKRRHVGGSRESGTLYHWTYVDDTKDSQFFSQVRVKHTASGARVVIRTLTEEQDGGQIERFEKRTGLRHQPLARSVTRTVTLTRQGERVAVKMTARAEISGMLELFVGRVRSGLLQSMHELTRGLSR